MSSVKLLPEQWNKIRGFLPGCAGIYVGQEADCRRFIEAVLDKHRDGVDIHNPVRKVIKGEISPEDAQKLSRTDAMQPETPVPATPQPNE